MYPIDCPDKVVPTSHFTLNISSIYCFLFLKNVVPYLFILNISLFNFLFLNLAKNVVPLNRINNHIHQLFSWDPFISLLPGWPPPSNRFPSLCLVIDCLISTLNLETFLDWLSIYSGVTFLIRTFLLNCLYIFLKRSLQP